jgi:hypothetical protein
MWLPVRDEGAALVWRLGIHMQVFVEVAYAVSNAGQEVHRLACMIQVLASTPSPRPNHRPT